MPRSSTSPHRLLKDRGKADNRTGNPLRRRALILSFMCAGAFISIMTQLIRIGAQDDQIVQLSMARTLGGSLARPDIVDRNGRLLATDISMPSLFADPARILDEDEVSEKISAVFPGLKAASIRKKLGNKRRRFVWLKRGISPALAQKVHDLGLPGLGFRNELRRIYPAGQMAGHILGFVNVDNRGMTGVERYIDEEVGVALVQGPGARDKLPVRLTLDLKVQYALRDEISKGAKLYGAKAAAGIVLDANSGDVLAMTSLPDFDSNRPSGSLEKAHMDRMTQGIFELGSVFKAQTVAMILDSGVGDLKSTYDARNAVKIGVHEIDDFHGRRRRLTLEEVFLYSSNLGAAQMGMDLGKTRMMEYFRQFGLMTPLKTEIGRSASPRLPKHWGEAEVMTTAFGHGMAVTPLQYAASSVALVNGGFYVPPRFVLTDEPATAGGRKRILKRSTSDIIRSLMRANVVGRPGTGRRADVPGYNVGGKTGTAEMPGRNGYDKRRVIASFVGAFPMEAPRYLTYVLLFEPQPSDETKGKITAGINAAPLTARIISRIAPLLKVLPQS